MTKNPTHLVWVDLETTGGYGDENIEILEIYAEITTMDPYDWTKGNLAKFHKIYRPTFDGIDALMKNSIVRKMHMENKLLDEIYDTPTYTAAPAYLTIPFNNWLRSNAVNGEGSLQWAGSGIAGFDIPWLKEYGIPGPNEIPLFTYASMDFGHLRRALRLAGRSDLEYRSEDYKIPHRAKNDIKEIQKEAQQYMLMLHNIGLSEEDMHLINPSEEEDNGESESTVQAAT